MKNLGIVVLLMALFTVLTVMPATAAHISVGNFNWDVSQPTINIPVYISGGETMNAASVALSVGDGGPLLDGTESIYFSAIDFGPAGMVWEGDSISTTDDYPGNAGLDMGEVYISARDSTTTANGKLMTFTLHAPAGGLGSRVGQSLVLNPFAAGAGDASNGGISLNPTYVNGTLTLTPEPSTLSLGGIAALALFAYRYAGRKAARRRSH